jgi:DnaJ family protein A protein 5
MGAGQSKEASEGAGSCLKVETKETLYEILGVERNCSDTDLKKAYKKQALLLHPDRNFENEEEATAKFAKVQAAYDILSDPQERAWYDSHGDDTRGADGPEYGGNVTSTEELKQYLDPDLDIIKELVSDPAKFYTTVGLLFAQLAREEHEAALDEGVEEPMLPPFGDGSSMWTRDVKPFYDAWGSFSSVKSFAWEDVYRSWDAPDRRSRRLMENRNKKVRDAARREFNTTVRSLITIVKQRDPRVRAQNKKAKSKSSGNSSAKEQAMRDRKANAAKRQGYVQQEWEIVDDLENQHPGEAEDASGEEVIEIYECVACDKQFKNKSQFKAHEASKKHKRAIKQLRYEMLKEGIELGFDESPMDSEEESDGQGREADNQKRASEISTKQARGDASNSDSVPVSSINGKVSEVFARDVDTGVDEDEDQSASKAQHVDSDSETESDKGGQLPKDPTLEQLLAELEGTRVSSASPEPSKKQTSGRAKQRRQKKKEVENEFANKCSVCQTSFSSRNKLFDHIKASGHALAPRKGGR